jgi:hypothetical protein
MFTSKQLAFLIFDSGSFPFCRFNDGKTMLNCFCCFRFSLHSIDDKNKHLSWNNRMRNGHVIYINLQLLCSFHRNPSTCGTIVVGGREKSRLFCFRKAIEFRIISTYLSASDFSASANQSAGDCHGRNILTEVVFGKLPIPPVSDN